MRNGKNNMKVLGWKEFCHSVLKPFGFGKELTFRTMSIPAGIIGIFLMGAVLAFEYVAAEYSCSAVNNILYYFGVGSRRRLEKMVVLSENITDLKPPGLSSFWYS